jgi:hypothetical protein
MVTEADIMRQIMIDVSKTPARLFRNNVALGWVGEAHQIRTMQTVRVGPGDVVIRNARPLHAGLCSGSSDLIGPVPVEIKPAHVGTTMALFGALEVKKLGGRVEPLQLNFCDQINRLGGIAGVVHDSAEALALLNRHTEGDA